MADALTIEDIDEKIRPKVYKQDYSPKKIIDGVKIIPLETHLGEDGDFSEVMRLKAGELEGFPGFQLAQMNKTNLYAHSIKAWHVHFRQDEIWYVPPSNAIFVGLWDIRKNSSTTNKTMRLTMGGGSSQLLFIPHGVAHGSANFTNQAFNMFYFVNYTFNIQDPDEQRINWDALGEEFWKPVRD